MIVFQTANSSGAAVIVALIAAGASLCGALVAGGISLWTNRKTNKNILAIEDFKSAVGLDMEHLKAKLAHGQVISTTQWNTEFAAYQALWKGLVDVRIAAVKSVTLEAELTAAGFPCEYQGADHVVSRTKQIAETLQAASQLAIAAIHNNAPFYPSHIREAANYASTAATDLLKSLLMAVLDSSQGKDTVLTSEFKLACVEKWLRIAKGIDEVEMLIRSRLESVSVIDKIL